MSVDAVREAASGRAARFFAALGGIASGTVGFLFGAWTFLYVGLFTGGADPHDQVASGLSVAALAGLIAAIVVPIAALRGRRRNPARSLGLMIGWLFGLVILINLLVVVYPVLDGLPGGCSCEPLIENLKPGPA